MVWEKKKKAGSIGAHGRRVFYPAEKDFDSRPPNAVNKKLTRMGVGLDIVDRGR